MAVNIGEAVIPTLMFEGETLVIEPKLMEHGRMQIVNRDLALGDTVAEVVGFAVNETRFKTSASGQHGEAARMVIAAVAFAYFAILTEGRAAKFTTPQHNRVLQHTPLLQILHQGGGCLIHLLAAFGQVSGQVEVVVPARVVELHKAAMCGSSSL